MKKSYLQFNKFTNFENLSHGIFPKSYGNIDIRFGEKNEIIKNRQEIAKILDIKLKNIYEMEQVHGTNIKILSKENIKKIKNNIIMNTDSLITNNKDIFLMIKTADCFPVIIFDPVKKVVAAVHVGWRGAIEGIFIKTILKMIKNFGVYLDDILIGIGPGIKKCCFKHKSLIQEKLPEWNKYIKLEKNNWKSVDIGKFIKNKLIDIGIPKKSIYNTDFCTGCTNYFFSHIRSQRLEEPEGRFATIIGIKDDKF